AARVIRAPLGLRLGVLFLGPRLELVVGDDAPFRQSRHASESPYYPIPSRAAAPCSNSPRPAPPRRACADRSAQRPIADGPRARLRAPVRAWRQGSTPSPSPASRAPPDIPSGIGRAGPIRRPARS